MAYTNANPTTPAMPTYDDTTEFCVGRAAGTDRRAMAVATSKEETLTDKVTKLVENTIYLYYAAGALVAVLLLLLPRLLPYKNKSSRVRTATSAATPSGA